MPLRLSCPGGSNFAIAMKCPLTSNRAQNDRRIEFDSEEFDGCVKAAYIDEACGTKLISRETVAIRLQRFFAVDTGHQVTPVGGRYRLLCERLKVKHIESVNDLFDIALLKCFTE